MFHVWDLRRSRSEQKRVATVPGAVLPRAREAPCKSSSFFRCNGRECVREGKRARKIATERERGREKDRENAAGFPVSGLGCRI